MRAMYMPQAMPLLLLLLLVFGTHLSKAAAVAAVAAVAATSVDKEVAAVGNAVKTDLLSLEQEIGGTAHQQLLEERSARRSRGLLFSGLGYPLGGYGYGNYGGYGFGYPGGYASYYTSPYYYSSSYYPAYYAGFQKIIIG